MVDFGMNKNERHTMFMLWQPIYKYWKMRGDDDGGGGGVGGNGVARYG